jgi:hypothetical protein
MGKPMTADSALQERVSHLEAASEIYDCMMRYARGVDRRDHDLLRSTYRDGAVDDHVGFVGDRYVDRLERRDERWAIVARVCVACVAEWIAESSSLTTEDVVAMLSAVQTPAKDRSDPCPMPGR